MAERMMSNSTSSTLDGLSERAGEVYNKASEKLGGAAESIKSGVQAGSDYFREHDVSDISSDLADLVRRYPIQSFCIGVGAGILLGSRLLSGR